MTRTKRAMGLGLAALMALGGATSDAAGHDAADDRSMPAFSTEECSTHPWIIGFAPGRSDLNDFARTRLDALAAAFRTDPGDVLVSGRVDASEDGRVAGLAERRIAAVVQELARRDVPMTSVWTRNDAGSHPLVPNVAGKPEAQNRIVFVTLPSEGSACARRLRHDRLDWVRRHCLATHTTACDAAWMLIDER